MIESPRLQMIDGHYIPQLGLGVYQSAPGAETEGAVLEALRLGYRHVDTAQFYGNEADVGSALRKSGLGRDAVFVTTKIANFNQGRDTTLRSLERSLKEAAFDAYDLVLIHFPVTGKRSDTWRALVDAQKQGLAKSIGVSNYTVRHLEELLDESAVVPAINQVELSPFLGQAELRAFCAKHRILVQAYSPLTQGVKLRHKVIVSAAAKAGRTPAQVMLRWAVQHGLIVLPKSVTPARIAENGAIFDFALDADTMRTLDGLDAGFRVSWDPTDVP
ncbi:putative 2,5-didehydrogluconate reductase [Sorangium cellulosum So ce56]|uniref:2,5-didehydrogluconate reductase n=2 Tax=Polyangiaceae TaxID=49 RepID=A9FTB8_SORC5|nr:putative 2,5-didehydrogluconate reductase [Sorangium cellulosum So ce56]